MRWLAPAGAAAVVLALGILAVKEAAVWRDDASVHERLFAREPGHGPALVRLAHRHAQDSRRARAEAQALRSDDPRYPGVIKAMNDARVKGLELAERAAVLPALRSDPEVTLLRANFYLDEGRPAVAEPEFRRARAQEPLLTPRAGEDAGAPRPKALARAVAIYDGLGRAYLAMGLRDRAADALLEAVTWERRAAAATGRAPDHVVLHRAAMSLISDGRFTDGLPLLAEVGASAPDAALRKLAGEQYAQAQKAAVERLEALLARGRALDEDHDEKAALEVYLEALHVEPDAVAARERAAILLKFFGRYREAKALVDEGLQRLDRVAPGPATDKERERLRSLRSDLDRWERENREEEEREVREHEERLRKKREGRAR
jgi:tetratricopeptide (TPR) repeat protein